MDWVSIHTQAELDAAIAAGATHVEVAAAITVEVRVPVGIRLAIRTIAGAIAKVMSGLVVARGSSRVVARGSSRVVARESSSVEAWGSSRVEARESSSVEAWGSSRVEARESSSVVARESSSVVAWESSRVEAWESSRVEAWESSRVEARESSSVEAWESSSVVARGSSRVVAWGAVAVSLFGSSITASASALCAVHLHGGAKCDGGVQIVVPEIATAAEWCEWHGVKIEGEHAVLYKGVNDKFASDRGAVYAPGTETVAPDWDGGKKECGLGLHFSPSAGATLEFAPQAKRFVCCLVPLNLIAVHPNGTYPQKVKAERCWNLCECDMHWKMIGERFEKPVATNAGE